VDKPDGQPKRLLDISRAAELLDWQPETNLYEGLEKTIEWYKKWIMKI
jgi:nucleoside-diphosphate-sugar epimerase